MASTYYTLANSLVTPSYPLLASDGSSSAPSYAFSSESTLGFYRSSSGVITSTGRMTIQSGSGVYGLLLGADFGASTLTNNTTKEGLLAVPNYANGSPGALAIMMQNGAASNDLYIGGGASGATSANTINFYTGAAISTTTGTSVGSINSSGLWNIGATGATSTFHNVKGNLVVAGSSGLSIQPTAASTNASISFDPTLNGNSNFNTEGQVISSGGNQFYHLFTYNDNSTVRQIARVDVNNTDSATASAAGGSYTISTSTAAGSLTSGFKIDQNQAITIGATTPVTGVFHTMNVDSATNNKGLVFAEKTATSATIISRGDVNTGSIKLSGGGSGANGGFIQVYGGSHATSANQVQIGNGGGATGIIVTSTGAVQLTGTNTNDSAAAGFYGEYPTQQRVTTPTNAPGSTTQYGNMASISLTAGDWDVTGVWNFTLNGATTTAQFVALSAFSANTTTDHQIGDNVIEANNPTAAGGRGQTLQWRVSIASTTTIYLKWACTYSAGNPQYTCRLSARRMR